jgi:hypothetical protein
MKALLENEVEGKKELILVTKVIKLKRFSFFRMEGGELLCHDEVKRLRRIYGENK